VFYVYSSRAVKFFKGAVRLAGWRSIPRVSDVDAAAHTLPGAYRVVKSTCPVQRHSEARMCFFFEKKKQKTFARLVVVLDATGTF